MCKHKKGQNSNNQANVVESDDLVVVIYKVNMTSNTKGWWIDTSNTRHICEEKSWFITYEKQDRNDKLCRGNASTAFVKVKGKILVKWTSRKILTLNDM